MDAHTARCLQLSTSIRMPFNPCRQYRIPDHLNRSRVPTSMIKQQPKQVPATTISNDSWMSGAPTKPILQTSGLPLTNTQTAYTQHQSMLSLGRECTPRSAELQVSYTPTCLTPENVNPNDLWDEALQFANSDMGFSGFEDLGLDLGTTGADFIQNSLDSKNFDSAASAFPLALNNFEPPAFGPRSPDRQSSSSLSECSGGFLSDFPDFSDLSPQSELACFNPDLSANLSTDLDSFMPFGDTTPKIPCNGFAKRAGRSITESSPRNRYRTSPYPVTGRGRSFSTGSVALPRTQSSSSYIHKAHQSLNFAAQTASPITESVSTQPFHEVEFEMFCQSQTASLLNSQIDDSSMFLPFSFDQPIHETRSPSSSKSIETANVLQSSNTAINHCEHHFGGSSEPPDLFGPLEQDQLSPPHEDVPCEDHDSPHAQELRFEGDLYTPKYVRGHGNKREGWCGICKPGRWLVLKNSAFWYDKSFTHGISAATGTAFEAPIETRRMAGNPDVWEGLCSSCGDWIALISSKKKGTTWFRHAYKCHTHQRVKDTPKRRREATNAKAKKVSKAVGIKSEPRDDSPYLLDSPLMSLDEMDLQNADIPNFPAILSATT